MYRVCANMLCPGASQDCSRNVTLTLDENVTEININTTTTFCFIVPVMPIAECQLNDAAMASSPPGITLNEPYQRMR